jgi:hypothetical protein
VASKSTPGRTKVRKNARQNILLNVQSVRKSIKEGLVRHVEMTLFTVKESVMLGFTTDDIVLAFPNLALKLS